MLIGVDVGGTKIAVAAMTVDGEILQSHRVATTHRALEDIVSLVKRTAVDPIDGVGVSVPGLVSADGVVRWAPNVPGWTNLPLRRLLEDALGAHVALGYDGHAALLGEAWRGAAVGLADVVMLSIGTGIGGAAIVDGRLLRGRDGIAGAAGWITDREWRGNHHQGELESLASGRAIAERGGWSDTAAMGKVHVAVGAACASLVSFLNPQRVILGGGTGMKLDCTAIHAEIRVRAQPTAAAGVDVVHAALAGDAAVLGATRFLS